MTDDPALDGLKGDFEPWTFEAAREMLAKAHAPLSRLGYVVALYGSVLHEGRGADLDLIAYSPRPRPSDPDLVYTILAAITRVEYVLVARESETIKGVTGYVWATRELRLIDLTVIG